MNKVAVIGGGSWGTALACVLADNGNKVFVWTNSEEDVNEVNTYHTNKKYLKDTTIPENVYFTTNFEEAMDGIELVVTALPSAVTCKVIDQNKQYFKENQILVNVSKGFEPESGKLLLDVLKDIVPCKLATLSGPSHAEEVSRGMATALVACSYEDGVAERVQKEFGNDYIRVYTNDDVVGAEIGGALKNIIALAAGISDGLNLGDNAKAALITRGISEIISYGEQNGAKVETFYGLTGMGDLIVTCGSMHSRNRRAGILLGEGKKLDDVLVEVGMVVEGAQAVNVVHTHLENLEIEMPLATEVYRIVYENKDPKQSLEELMKREQKPENGKE